MAIKKKAKPKKMGWRLGSRGKPPGYRLGSHNERLGPESHSEQKPAKGPNRKRGPERKK